MATKDTVILQLFALVKQMQRMLYRAGVAQSELERIAKVRRSIENEYKLVKNKK